MIGLDTNILVYARREETPQHARALRLVTELANGTTPWAIPWPCLYEFLRVVTHPRVFDPPTPLDEALAGLDALLESPSLTLLGAGPAHRAHALRALHDGHATGNHVHDAHIAALLVEHGVREFWTADRGFARFPGLHLINPLDAAANEPRTRYRSRQPVRSGG